MEKRECLGSFSCFTSEKALAGGLLLSQVQRHWQPMTASSLAMVYTDLCGEVDSNNAALLGDRGLQRGKLLPKPRAKLTPTSAATSLTSRPQPSMHL